MHNSFLPVDPWCHPFLVDQGLPKKRQKINESWLWQNTLIETDHTGHWGNKMKRTTIRWMVGHTTGKFRERRKHTYPEISTSKEACMGVIDKIHEILLGKRTPIKTVEVRLTWTCRHLAIWLNHLILLSFHQLCFLDDKNAFDYH